MNTQHISELAGTAPVIAGPVVKQQANLVQLRMRFPPVTLGLRYIGAGTAAKWQRVSVHSRRVPLSRVMSGLSSREREAVAAARARLLEDIRATSNNEDLPPLTYYRLRAKLTQQALADAAGLQQSKISFYENNPERLTTQAAKKLARPLGIDFRDLLS
jgi:DNA-binding XRE family transcriptional regulator